MTATSSQGCTATAQPMVSPRQTESIPARRQESLCGSLVLCLSVRTPRSIGATATAIDPARKAGARPAPSVAMAGAGPLSAPRTWRDIRGVSSHRAPRQRRTWTTASRLPRGASEAGHGNSWTRTTTSVRGVTPATRGARPSSSPDSAPAPQGGGEKSRRPSEKTAPPSSAHFPRCAKFRCEKTRPARVVA